MHEHTTSNRRLGIVVGGGPAPGINGVIAAAAREARRHGLEVIGIYDGFRWLAAGDATHTCPLTLEMTEAAQFRGGSILRTARENPTESEQKLNNVLACLERLGIRYLVTIGGDDTAYTATRLAAASGALRIAHVPKTIDNDLPLPANQPTFGFRTACQLGATLLANLLEDARTTNRWGIVVTMGRSAGHLALGMGAAAGASLILIAEEFTARQPSLTLLCKIIEGAVFKGRAAGNLAGLAVLAEGLAIPMQKELETLVPVVEIQRDPHNNPRLAEVPLAMILKRRLAERAKQRGQKWDFIHATIGYELRCAPPVAFDAQYTQQLGWGAVQHLLGRCPQSQHEPAVMISIQDGKLAPISFSQIIDPATKKTRLRQVDITSDEYLAVRARMLRLVPEDFQNTVLLAAMADAAGMNPEQFRQEYEETLG
jgi:6-phosphofructokinase 1